jgi:hypothetical protein
MTRQPSLTSDYVSLILRAIETTKNDPAQLRRLVYELARMSLGKQILLRFNEIGGTELRQHLYWLETAIKKVEKHSEDDEELLGQRSGVHLIDGPVGLIDQGSAVDLDRSVGAIVDDAQRDNRNLVVRQAPDDFYYQAHPLPTFLNSSQTPGPAQNIIRLPRRVWAVVWPTLQLLIAVVLGVAIYVGFVARSDYAPAPKPPHPEDVAQSLRPPPGTQKGLTSRPGMPDSSRGLDSAGRSGAPDFELPTVYGVYALSEGKLLQLESLPIKVPDPRVAISAMISKPSPTTIQGGKIAFVVFRRDLVSSAPDKVSIRVVARVVREMTFTGAGVPKTSKVDDQWAVRSNSYEFEVAPLNDNPEMILIRPASPQFALPAGRYALALKGQAFDFNVDGQITDVTQCLERTGVVGGEVYSECRKIP